MPLEKTFGNESYCTAVNCSICSCEHWGFNETKTFIKQYNNTNLPAVGLGSEKVMGVNFNGTFKTIDTGDDDMIGFVFGFEDPSHFYVVYAAKFNATNGHHMDPGRFRITRVNSVTGVNSPEMKNAIFSKDSVPNQTEVLWKDSEDRGWLPNKEYTWVVKFRPLSGSLQLEIFEESEPLFNTGVISINITTVPARLGVFTYSQPNTMWYDMWYECDDRELE